MRAQPDHSTRNPFVRLNVLGVPKSAELRIHAGYTRVPASGPMPPTIDSGRSPTLGYATAPPVVARVASRITVPPAQPGPSPNAEPESAAEMCAESNRAD